MQLSPFIQCLNGSVVCNFQIDKEIVDMDQCIDLINRSIRDKESALIITQTKLATRTRRPGIEACRDNPYQR